MGFIGGVGNIAIVTAQPPASFVYCIENIKEFIELLYLIFYSCLRLRFLDVGLTLARGILFLLSAEYSSNVRGLAGNLSDLTMASSQYDILLCSETFVSDMCHVSELLVPGFGRPAGL